MPKFIVKITNENENILANNQDIECFVVSTALSKPTIQRIVNDIIALKKIVLLEGESAEVLCQELGADGIIADLSKSEAIKKDMAILRKKIGDGVLGVISRNRRHEAMIVSENDPDFIVFRAWSDGKEKVEELSRWYSELFFIQQAVELSDDEIGFDGFSADMVILSPNRYKILVAKN